MPQSARHSHCTISNIHAADFWESKVRRESVLKRESVPALCPSHHVGVRQNFAKSCSVLNSLYQFTIQLTFENLYLRFARHVMWECDRISQNLARYLIHYTNLLYNWLLRICTCALPVTSNMTSNPIFEFSKVNSMVVLHGTLRGQLTFENFQYDFEPWVQISEKSACYYVKW